MNSLSIDSFMGGPVEDIVSEMKSSSAWNTMVTDAADKVWERVKVRMVEDKVSIDNMIDNSLAAATPRLQQMAKETVTAIEPEAKQAMLDIFNDAETQARIGQTQEEIKSSVTNILIIGGVSIVAASSLATWLIVKNYSSKK